MLDLAGNAMTSTIVGTCILSALLLGQDYLKAHELPPPSTSRASSSKSPHAKAKKAAASPGKPTPKSDSVPPSPSGYTGSGLITSTGRAVTECNVAYVLDDDTVTKLELAPLPSALSLAELLSRGAASARMCISEG